MQSLTTDSLPFPIDKNFGDSHGQYHYKELEGNDLEESGVNTRTKQINACPRSLHLFYFFKKSINNCMFSVSFRHFSPGTSSHTYQVDFGGSRAPIDRFCSLFSFKLLQVLR